MAKIFLVRHGQDEDNLNGILNGRRDTPLTGLGKQQAEIVAQKLQLLKIEVIFSSPLIRANQTANIIATALNIKNIILNDNLIERDFGILSGCSLSDIPKLSSNIVKGDKVNYFLDGDGVETFETLYERASLLLNHVRSSYIDKNILFVTHGDIGKMIYASFHGLGWNKGLLTPYFQNTGILELS